MMINNYMKDNRQRVIYKISNKINGKVYIGLSVEHDIRWDKHIRLLTGDKHTNLKLQRAWNKYGSENFTFEVIDTCDGFDDACILEKKYISDYDSFKNGYNLTIGGEGTQGIFGEDHWNSIPVYQYDTQGNYLKKYSCISDAARKYNLNVANLKKAADDLRMLGGFVWAKEFLRSFEVCNFHRYDLDGFYLDSFHRIKDIEVILGKHTKNFTRDINSTGKWNGFQWKTKYIWGGKIKPWEEPNWAEENQGIKIKQLDKDTEEVLNTFNSLSEAARHIGKEGVSAIGKCVKGKLKTAYGFKWRQMNENKI